MGKKFEDSSSSPENGAQSNEQKQDLSRQANSVVGDHPAIATTAKVKDGLQANYAGIFSASDPVVPTDLPTTPAGSAGTDVRFQAPQSPPGAERTVAPQQTGSDQVVSGASRDGSFTRTTPVISTNEGPSKVVPGNTDHAPPGYLGLTLTPVVSELKPAVVLGTRTSGDMTYQPGDSPSNPAFKVGDSGIKTPGDVPSSSNTPKSGVFTFTRNENGGTVVRKPETAPDVQNPSLERSVPSSNLVQDRGQQKPFMAPETQPRSNPYGEQSGGQNQTRSLTPERVDGLASAPKVNTGASVETANFTRQTQGALENQNQVKVANLTTDAQTRTVSGVFPDSGSRDLTGHDGLTRNNVSGNALDSQGRQIPVVGADKLPLGLDKRQTPADVAGARVVSPQTSLDIQGKQIAGNAPSDAFGTRREIGVQLPDTKQTSGRTDSGIQLPDTKQSSGRTDTGGTKLPDARNDTGRNDANTGKLPDAKTLANLDQKFGDKVNPPGKGGGVPIAIPGIPDILGDCVAIKIAKPAKMQKADSQGTKDGTVKNEAPGGRDAKDAKGESQGAKDSKVSDGKGDTKSGADGKSAAGEKGVRSESENSTKSSDGKTVQGDRGSTIKSDLGDKGHTDAGAGTKAIGSRSDAPFVLPPGSLPVPDLVGGLKNIGQQIDGRTGKPIPSDDKGLRQPDKIDGAKIDTTKANAGKVDAARGDATKGDASKIDPDKSTAGKTDVTKGDPAKGDGVKTTATDGVKTTVTGGVGAGDGVKTAVTGSAKGADVVKGADGVKGVGVSDSSADGKQISGKNPVGNRLDGALIVPPVAVPLTEMIGNLKGIAARIFPPESRTGRPDAFDNSLPGRKTERLEDRTQSTLGAGVRSESTIPIVRAIGERIGKADEQFVIKVPQSVLDANKATPFKVEPVATPPWIAVEHTVSDKSLPGLKAVEANAAKLTDAKSTKNEVQPHAAKAGDQQVPHADKHDQIVHDEAAERLLVNLELVGSVESAPVVESEEEEVFPLAAIEYFGGEFEKSISDEEEVMFDGDGAVVEDDEQSTRYQYIVEAGDTVELIAIKVFKNVTLAPLIYEINKDAIPIGMQDGRMIFTLKVGTVIWLPFPKEVKAYMGI